MAAENLLATSLFEAGMKRLESESVRPPTCQIGRYKHQAIGKNTEIQQNTHCIIIEPTEMNCMVNFRRVDVSQRALGSCSRQPQYDLEPT